jgi:hypothetical protein
MSSHDLSKNVYLAKTRSVDLDVANKPYRLQIRDIFVDDQDSSITF